MITPKDFTLHVHCNPNCIHTVGLELRVMHLTELDPLFTRLDPSAAKEEAKKELLHTIFRKVYGEIEDLLFSARQELSQSSEHDRADELICKAIEICRGEHNAEEKEKPNLTY